MIYATVIGRGGRCTSVRADLVLAWLVQIYQVPRSLVKWTFLSRDVVSTVLPELCHPYF